MPALVLGESGMPDELLAQAGELGYELVRRPHVQRSEEEAWKNDHGPDLDPGYDAVRDRCRHIKARFHLGQSRFSMRLDDVRSADLLSPVPRGTAMMQHRQAMEYLLANRRVQWYVDAFGWVLDPRFELHGVSPRAPSRGRYQRLRS